MTIISDRHPREKAHAKRGHAHAALSQRVTYRWRGDSQAPHYILTADVALYTWRDDAWTLLWEGSRGDQVDPTNPAWKAAS